jgi:hypothetical protein
MAEPKARNARFAYYRKLGKADQRTYVRSDAIRAVELPDANVLRPRAENLQAALSTGKRVGVERAARDLCRGITEQLAVLSVVVRVRSVRPSDQSGELHGLYTWEEGKAPVIEVWMRTAMNEQVVAFRTFLRTLLHEVCHHLDFTLFELPETFHTAGFFQRESSLMRQLVGAPARRRAPVKRSAAAAPKSEKKPKQLRLFA